MSLLRLVLARWAVRRARKAVNRYMRAAERLAGLGPFQTRPDPLADLVQSYMDGCQAYSALPVVRMTGPGNSEACFAAAQTTYWPQYIRLLEDPPAATSLAGVAAAFRLILDDPDDGALTRSVAKAAQRYFVGDDSPAGGP